jgi:serine/threonine-protein kinase
MQMIDAQLVQSKIPSLRNLRLLAQGGQKLVFSALHNDFGGVVVKLVYSSQPDKRIEREIEIITSCSIPNTAQIHSWGTFEHNDTNITYIVEEFIQGVTLRRKLQTDGRLPMNFVLSLLEALLETAMAMEKEGVVHRDIKPENIMVCDDGTFKLLDFGIARYLSRTSITPTDAHFGPHTAGYAAPEQFRNLKKKIDIRTDLFAIGVVAYECLTGNHPFAEGARDRLDILRRTEQMMPPSLQIAGDSDNRLARYIFVLMAKYPSRRPPTAAAAKEWFDSMRESLNTETE